MTGFCGPDPSAVRDPRRSGLVATGVPRGSCPAIGAVVRIETMIVEAIARRKSDNLTLVAAFLSARRAEFVVVGGCALRLHGVDHVPADLDVTPEPSLANLRRLFDALAQLGTVGRVWPPTDHALATRDILTRTTPVGSVDVMLVTGRREYASLERAAHSIDVHQHPVRVAAIDDTLRLRARFGKPLVHV
jgi:hypothetical protein